VIPEGPQNAPDSVWGKLEDIDGFHRFMEEALSTLRQRGGFVETNFTSGGISLSRHSGGNRVTTAITDRGGLAAQVRKVWLFDVLHAQAEKFQAWSATQGGRLVNIYTDSGAPKSEPRK
jgi:predicted amidohydrolase